MAKEKAFVWVVLVLASAPATSAQETSPTPTVPDLNPAEGAVAPSETTETTETIRATDGATEEKPPQKKEPEPTANGKSEEPTDVIEIAAEKEKAKALRTFGFRLSLGHGIGAGTFMGADCPGSGFEPIDDLEAELAAGYQCVGNRGRYVVQSWDLRPSFNFELFGHRLTAMARWVFNLEFTTPDENPPRRFAPLDASLTLIDPEVYKEPFLGIAFAAALRVFVPTSFASLNATTLIMGMQLRAKASRSLGPVDLSYTFALRKNFHAHPVSQTPSTARESDNLVNIGHGVDVPKGYPNTEWRFSNTWTVAWHPIEELSIGYSLLLYHNLTYNTHPAVDEYTAPYAQAGAQNRSDMLWPTFEVTYNFSQGLSEVVELPLDFLAAVGATALHPAQEPNNKGFIVPVVFNTFGPDKAPHNYATLYLNLIAVY